MATGFLDSNGDPWLKVKVSNPIGWAQELDCLIDTGFTGFLSIPLLLAFPIGLLLTGTAAVTLADGTQAFKLTCLGMAEVDDVRKLGVVIIEPSSEQVLLGMDFLRKFSLRLEIDPQNSRVELQPSVKVPPPTPTAELPTSSSS